VSSEHPLVQLARRTIERYIREGYALQPTECLGDLGQQRAGAFVSLHRNGELRGCIGTIECTQPDLECEIIHNAINSATRDPRFPPLSPDELDDLDISVDVLGEPERIESPDQLDPRRYGVIVEHGSRRGLLLPDLEGVDTPDQQVQIALRKAWIDPGQPYRLYRFLVERYR
jgi:AmmeMemoRadiSam system protein A